LKIASLLRISRIGLFECLRLAKESKKAKKKRPPATDKLETGERLKPNPSNQHPAPELEPDLPILKPII
jgi:hypothetical protein